MAAAWVSMVSYQPPKLAITLGNHHYTNKGIKANGVFSVNFPSTVNMKAVDYAGLVTGEKEDKSQLFTAFYGQSENAPMISEFKLNVECKLDKIVVNGLNETFIGDIVGIHADESILKDGKRPFASLFSLRFEKNAAFCLFIPISCRFFCPQPLRRPGERKKAQRGFF